MLAVELNVGKYFVLCLSSHCFHAEVNTKWIVDHGADVSILSVSHMGNEI